MRFILATFVAKVTFILLSATKGGGSTLPGLLAEKIQPSYLKIIKQKISAKVVVVSGTNGKTTTTKMIADSLSKLGCNVLTNSSGSNFTRGIITVFAVNYSKTKQYEYIVLEVDEAYAPIICEVFKPDIFVALNVFRDQLDRYGEIDATASYLHKAALFADKVISNATEIQFSHINKLKNVYKIAASKEMQKQLPTDNNLYSDNDVVHTTDNSFISLDDFEKGVVTYRYGDDIFTINMRLGGVYNAFNLCFALSCLLLLEVSVKDANSVLQNIEPAFGRGEIIEYNDKNITLFLSKNPAGFNHIIEQLKSEVYDDSSIAFMINDQVADGKDVSWLWDVAFEQLDSKKIYQICGSRNLDMALRLKMINKKYILRKNINEVINNSSNSNVVFVTTYTAMNEIRQFLRDHGVSIGALS